MALNKGDETFMRNSAQKKTNPKCNFMQYQSDPCVFYTKGMIVLCYVDNCLKFYQHDKMILNLLSSLKEDFLCTDGGRVDGHL